MERFQDDDDLSDLMEYQEEMEELDLNDTQKLNGDDEDDDDVDSLHYDRDLDQEYSGDDDEGDYVDYRNDINEFEAEDNEEADEEYDDDLLNEEDYSVEDAKVQALEDEQLADSIITSIQQALPEQKDKPQLPKAPIKMTDLGFRISQMVLLKQPKPEEVVPVEEAEAKDILLERHLSGRRRNKTGVRGRPKGVDHGFGKSTTQNLSPEVAKLMGQANIAYVERRYEDAVPLLLEVIRLSSSSFEPYHTLGLVYEESGQFEKAFSYYLLAAHLSKGDSELWAKLTGIAVKLGKKREVIYCLSKFMHITKMKDPLPFWIRSRLYLEISSYHNVIFSFGELLRYRLKEIDQFQAVAKLALKINLSASCAKLFRNIFKEAASNTSKLSFNDVTWSHLNLLLELYAATKDYDGLISAVEEFAPLIHGSGKKSLNIVDFSMGQAVSLEDCLPSLPIDLKVKLAVAHINLKTASPPYQIDQLLTELDDPDYGDLRLALGDALYEQGEYLLGLYSFLPLMQHYQYGDTKLCIKIAECYKFLGQIAEAVETLTAAAHLDPENNQVRLALSEIYRLASRPDLSAEILKDYAPSATENAAELDLDPERIYAEVFGPTNVSLLYEDEVEDGVAESNADGETLMNFPYLSSSRKHPALRQIRRRARKVPHMRYSDSQVEQAQSDFNRAKIYYDLFLAKLANGEPTGEDVNAFVSISTKRIQDLVDNPHLRSEFKFRGVPPEIAEDLGSLHGLRVDEWFTFLWMHLVVLGKSGSADNALRLLRNYFLVNSAFSRDALLVTKLRFLHVALAKAAGKDLWALVGTRWFLAAYPNQSFPSLLNLACLSTGKACSLLSVHPQNYRPLLRNARMSPSLFFTQITHGHIAMASLIPKDALDAYERALKCLEERDDSKWIDKARIRTLAANAMLHLSYKRTCPNPKILLTKAFSLLMYNYQEALAANPEHLPECLYNMARCFQMSGLLAKSEPLYRKLLDIADTPISIKRAAAHNLHLIYFQSGNFDLARSVLACNVRF